MTIPAGKDPDTFATAINGLIASHPEGSRLHTLGTDLLRAHAVNQDRRAAVLKYPDLAKRLVTECGYASPQQWNGYIPPSSVHPGSPDEMCNRAITDLRTGGVIFRHNQIGRRGLGEMPNDSGRRAVLLAISQEAWEREQGAAVEARAAAARAALKGDTP